MDAVMVSIEGESMRRVTWCMIEEVESGDWGIGGKALTTADVHAFARKGCVIARPPWPRVRPDNQPGSRPVVKPARLQPLADAPRPWPSTRPRILLFGDLKGVGDDLGYRRYEWKCNALNAPSRAAATRLGFQSEGIFRQADVIKGRNRDTAWFATRLAGSESAYRH
jgi:hypothetical protein